MKKALLFIAAVLMSASMFAQTRITFISERFDGSSMPAGWQVVGSGTTNWSISGSNTAGGQANELKLHWEPQFNGTSRMVMPAVDLTDVSSVVVNFKHALDNYSGSHTIGIATSSDGGATWNVGWQQNYSSSNSWSITQDITTADMGNSSVQFCLFYTGNSYNINDWFFDDIEIFSQENLDMSLNSINVNSTVSAGNTFVAFSVQNKGVETINQFKVSYQINAETPVEEVFETTLASLATGQFTFTVPMTLVPGTYSLFVNVMEVNGASDDDLSNNSLTNEIGVALGSTQRIPMIEHFSSSTCGPCVSVNTTMLNLCNNNPGKFTYTKYQMNWPGNGDPYYTNEGGTRRTYYGVSAVPQCFLDGEDQGYAAVTQTTLDNHYNNPAFADVRGSFNVSGGVITVKVDFMSYYDLSTAKAFVSVNEKETHNNVGTNGETSFHHVFMKFLTDATGDAVNIEAGNYQHFEYSYDMSSTHVEEMSDLEVSAWIQNYNTKEMLNSHFLYEYTDIHPYPVRDLAVALNEGMLTATWTAPEGFNAQAYNVYVNGVFAETVTGYEYSAPATADFNVVEVEAVYENDMTSVKMVKVASGDAPVACDPVTDLVAEYAEESGEHGAFVSWTAPAGAIEFMVYAGEYLYTTNGTSVFAGFDEEPAGTYTISVIAVYNECESDPVTVDFEWAGTTAVDETAVATNIYPNPTSGNFTIEGADMARVEVYNLVGQKVYEAQGKTVTVDASNWNKGIYMINILDQNGSSKTQKLMVK
jgi:hypothetical protein